MHDLETRLREVDVPEPPLGFDPDEVADRAARHVRQRRAGITGTLVVALAVVAVAVFAPGGTRVAPAVPPSLAEQARIRQALTDAVTGLFPGVRSVQVSLSPADTIGPGRMTVTAAFTDGADRLGSLQLTVRGAAAAGQVVPADRLCSAPASGARCTRVPRPDGGLLVLSELAHADLGGVVVHQEFNGFLYRSDGSTVTVVKGEGSSLTAGQLTRLITDPAFVLRQ